jgi:hypothetical protein
MAVSAFAALPANANVNNTGTINVTGSVAPKCTATAPLNGDIALGELAEANGTVNRTFSNAATGALTKKFTVTCTSPSANLSVNALPLRNNAVTTVTSGYTNTVHYTATLTATKAVGGSVSAIDTSNIAGATTQDLSGRLANAADNVTVIVSNGNTTNADLLEAGNYTGSIAITVAPSS